MLRLRQWLLDSSWILSPWRRHGTRELLPRPRPILAPLPPFQRSLHLLAGCPAGPPFMLLDALLLLSWPFAGLAFCPRFPITFTPRYFGHPVLSSFASFSSYLSFCLAVGARRFAPSGVPQRCQYMRSCLRSSAVSPPRPRFSPFTGSISVASRRCPFSLGHDLRHYIAPCCRLFHCAPDALVLRLSLLLSPRSVLLRGLVSICTRLCVCVEPVGWRHTRCYVESVGSACANIRRSSILSPSAPCAV